MLMEDDVTSVRVASGTSWRPTLWDVSHVVATSWEPLETGGATSCLENVIVSEMSLDVTVTSAHLAITDWEPKKMAANLAIVMTEGLSTTTAMKSLVNASVGLMSSVVNANNQKMSTSHLWSIS